MTEKTLMIPSGFRETLQRHNSCCMYSWWPNLWEL